MVHVSLPLPAGYPPEFLARTDPHGLGLPEARTQGESVTALARTLVYMWTRRSMFRSGTMEVR